MSQLSHTPFAVLDLAPMRDDDAGPGPALRRSLDLARHVERLGFSRLWVAEHHNMEGIASSATAVLLGYLAANTSSLRLGSGGVMLPNHAPLVVAEQFGTLAALYPGRIELGLGRAPGADQATARALRRERSGSADDFPDDVEELSRYLGPRTDDQKVIAVPGHDTDVPLWLLGSSLYGAQLAAQLGEKQQLEPGVLDPPRHRRQGLLAFGELAAPTLDERRRERIPACRGFRHAAITGNIELRHASPFRASECLQALSSSCHGPCSSEPRSPLQPCHLTNFYRGSGATK